VVDPVSKKSIPCKVLYHFPFKHFIAALYRRRDLIPHLWHDSGEASEGSIKRSRGFYHKVLNNPVMNADHRNIALVGTTDGVPFFDDQRRGGWPFFFRYVYMSVVLCIHIYIMYSLYIASCIHIQHIDSICTHVHYVMYTFALCYVYMCIHM
jgi:hypothetical protein